MRPRPFLAAPVLGLALALAVAGSGACAATAPRTAPRTAPAFRPDSAQAAFVDTLERRTFDWFWEVGDPRTGMVPDRWPTPSFVSVAAVGFGLTAYPIGAERGWITRAQAAERALATLEFFWAGRQDTARAGCMGHRGFFYHFLDPRTGHRFQDVELSTMDTALLLGGALFCQSWFDGADAREARIRALADSLYRRVDWTWAQPRPPAIGLGWHPETGHLPYDYRGYNETMLLYVLALGSPTHPVGPGAWTEYTRGYRWGRFHGQEYLGFAPLFGHHYSHVWIDFRGIQDDWMRRRGIDYHENSRRATLAQRAYAIANPGRFRGYSATSWGLTACDGPLDGEVTIDGRRRAFRTYAARGACFTEIVDDGTLAPTAAAGSIPYAPEVVIPTLVALRDVHGERLLTRHGFLDSFNPTLTADVKTQHGAVVPGVGWYDADHLGIDQGPILAMIENWRSDLVWRVMRGNPHIVRGLRRAGFTGGWLERAPREP